MARVKFSGLIDSINGSIGGTTFQRNRYGNTIKAKRSATRPQTASQLSRQNKLAQVSKEWRLLTTSQQLAWNTYAQTYPVASRLNPAVNLSGFNYFLRYHEYKRMATTEILTDPNGTRNNITDSNPTIYYSVGSIDFNSNFVGLLEETYIIVKITPTIRQSINNYKSLLRYVGSKLWTIGSQQFTIGDGIIEAFGTLPTEDEPVGIQLIAVNRFAAQVDVIANVKKDVFPE